MADQQSVLLLGMVYSDEHVPKRGQEYRDRVRCAAMSSLGYDVKTLDNKHSDVKLPNHCTANFADTRRMISSMKRKWDDLKFDHVFLDYFMSPVGWARTRWTDPLFTDTFPTLAKRGMLAPDARIWLPNLQCIEESIESFSAYLEPYFTIRLEHNPSLNPLYVATDRAEEDLLLCPDLITNETQVLPILEHARDGALFYVLQLKPSAELGSLASSPTEKTSGTKRSGSTVADYSSSSPDAPTARRQKRARAQE